MVGHKLGEFSPTRIFKGHSGKLVADKKAKPEEIQAAAPYLDAFDPELLEWITESQVAALISDNYAVEGVGVGPKDDQPHTLLPMCRRNAALMPRMASHANHAFPNSHGRLGT